MKKAANATRCPAITASTNIWTPGSWPQASAKTRKDRYSGASKRATAHRQSADPQRRALHDQAEGQRSRLSLLHLLPYFSGDGDYGLSAERWHARARAANRRAP